MIDAPSPVPTDLTLDSVAGGALPEKFAHALRGVVDNILDPNTEAEDKRKISIVMTLTPTEERTSVTAIVEVSVKLASPKADAGQIYIGHREGELVAVTFDPRQSDLFDTEESAQVRPIHTPREA